MTSATVLVIHVNAFNKKIDSGYLMRDGQKVGKMLSASEIVEYDKKNRETRIETLFV